MSMVGNSPEQPSLHRFTHRTCQERETQVPNPRMQVVLLDEVIPLPGDPLGFHSPCRCPNIHDASKHWLKLSLLKDKVGQIHDSC